MIGYFSLNVPSGLTLYWFTNNLVTTAQQVYLEAEVQGADRVAELGRDVRGAAQAGANGADREGVGGPARGSGD